ncbi:MAG: TolC family protein, partial [Sphingomonadales bacterium]|nr:TolC family protein [Sphingomonadales bacterium]
MKARAALAATFALAACTAGPDYRFPARSAARLPAAQAPFAAAAGPAFNPAEPPDHWWRLYGDPRLDGYVTEALAANADLRVADANLARADAVVREVAVGRTVATTVSGGVTLARPAGTGAALPGTVATDLGIALAYPLDLAGKVRRAIEAARADAEAVAAARDAVRVNVAAEVARSYAAACSANRTLAATRGVLAVQQDTLAVTERLQRGGRGTAFDVTRARAAVQQSAALVPAILATRSAALYRLATLMGRPPADWPRDAEACAAGPAMARPLPVGDGGAL